jgi:hypothetical protein
MKTTRLNLARLLNDEHIEYISDLCQAFKGSPKDKLNLAKELSNLETQLTREREAFLFIRKSVYTAEILKSAKELSETYRGLQLALKASLRHFDESKRLAAQRIQGAIDVSGHISRFNFTDKTSMVCSLTDLAQNNLLADFEILDLNHWISELSVRNRNYIQLEENRKQERSLQTKLRMKQVRTETDKTYLILFNRIDALILVNGSKKYEKLVIQLNTITKFYKDNITRRFEKKAKYKAVENNDPVT